MKKLLAFILAAVMAFSMVACGGGEANEGGEASGEGTADTQPVGAVENSYNPAKLSTFGLPEPSFDYSYEYYDVRSKEGVEHPEFNYIFEASREDTLAYMKEVSAVWGGWTHDSVPTMAPGDSFWFSTDYENYHISINWFVDAEDVCFMYVRDYSKNMIWDQEKAIDYIEGLGEYGTYGVHTNDYVRSGKTKPH